MNDFSYLISLCQLQNVPYSIQDNQFRFGTGTIMIPYTTKLTSEDFKKKAVASMFSPKDSK